MERTAHSNAMIRKSILVWLSIIPLGILNGGLREVFLIPRIGERVAEPVSGIILCVLILTVSLIFIPRTGRGTQNTYWKIGVVWIVLTVVFETALGLAMGHSPGEIWRAYDPTTGNLWSAVVVFTGIAPWSAAKIRRII